MIKRTLIFFGLIFAIVACDKGSLPTSSPGDVATGVIGGFYEKSKSDVSYVTVALRGTRDKDPMCTATVIHSRLLLTAAHCVYAMDEDDVEAAFDLNGANKKAIVRRIAKIWRHENHLPVRGECPMDEAHGDCEGKDQIARMGSRHDLALLLLRTPVPPGYRPVRVATGIDWKQLLPTAKIAGYGIDTALTKFKAEDVRQLARHSGRLKAVTTSASAILDQVDVVEKYQTILGVPTADASMCSGDSGGPMFVQDARGLLQVGVSSYLFDGKEAMPCGYKHSAYVDLSAHGDWIAATSKKLLTGVGGGGATMAVGVIANQPRILEKSDLTIETTCSAPDRPDALRVTMTSRGSFLNSLKFSYRQTSGEETFESNSSWDEDQSSLTLYHDVFTAQEVWEKDGDRVQVLRALLDKQPFSLAAHPKGWSFSLNADADLFFGMTSLSEREMNFEAKDLELKFSKGSASVAEKLACKMNIKLADPLFTP